MAKQIRIIALRMGEKPQVEMMDSGLDAMQAFVGGSIEYVPLDRDLSSGVDLWCNEEGLFTCKPNRHVTGGQLLQPDDQRSHVHRCARPAR